MRHRLRSSLLAAALAAPPPVAGVEDADRGGSLYENHCTQCHDTSVHLREERKVHDAEELREWVFLWQDTLSLGWTVQEIEDVEAFLLRFYEFDGD